jgi:hypothetical protein
MYLEPGEGGESSSAGDPLVTHPALDARTGFSSM